MRAPGVLITVAAWVTLVFAALEFLAARYPEKCPPISGLTGPWSPSSLPPLEKTEIGRKPRSYAHAVAEVIFGFLVLAWLLLIPGHPFLLMGPGAVVLDVGPFRLADAWWTFYWWIVVLNALQLAWRCIDLLRGAWQYPSEIQHIRLQDLRPRTHRAHAPGARPRVYSAQASGHRPSALRRGGRQHQQEHSPRPARDRDHRLSAIGVGHRQVGAPEPSKRWRLTEAVPRQDEKCLSSTTSPRQSRGLKVRRLGTRTVLRRRGRGAPVPIAQWPFGSRRETSCTRPKDGRSPAFARGTVRQRQ